MTISFARHQFPPAIMRHAVWVYVRFTLSCRDVEDLRAERGLDVSCETVRRWVSPCLERLVAEDTEAAASGEMALDVESVWTAGLAMGLVM
jgi:transposase-like protein